MESARHIFYSVATLMRGLAEFASRRTCSMAAERQAQLSFPRLVGSNLGGIDFSAS